MQDEKAAETVNPDEAPPAHSGVQSVTPLQFFDNKGRSGAAVPSRKEQLAAAMGAHPSRSMSVQVVAEPDFDQAPPDGQMASDPSRVTKPVHPSERRPRPKLVPPPAEPVEAPLGEPADPPAPEPELPPAAKSEPAADPQTPAAPRIAPLRLAKSGAEATPGEEQTKAAEGDDLPF